MRATNVVGGFAMHRRYIYYLVEILIQFAIGICRTYMYLYRFLSRCIGNVFPVILNGNGNRILDLGIGNRHFS